MKSRYISREESVIKTRLLFWEERLENVINEKSKIQKQNNTKVDSENDNNEDKEEEEESYSALEKDSLTLLLTEALAKTEYVNIETLFRMLDFQLFDLENKGNIETMEELEVYAENTRSLLIYLNLNLLNIQDEKAFICASHVGRGVGIVDILKRMPSLIHLNINQMPKSLITKYVGSTALLFSSKGEKNERMYDVILEMAAYAKKHIEVAAQMSDELKENESNRNIHIAFMQCIDSYHWLKELEEYNFNVFEPNLKKIKSFSLSRKISQAGKSGKYFI